MTKYTMFSLTDDTIRGINTFILILVIYPSLIIAWRSYHSHSTLKSIRFVLSATFFMFTIACLLSLYINFQIGRMPSDVIMDIANIRNLIKNSGLLILVCGLFSIHQEGGDNS